ncbi:mRNA export factor elf1 [Grifola frondosa]|uniref:Elongation factor 3 n=1 Tax=Grifola frondosa TaxID=5627 RepID=A0A1C7LUK1_GRIFR|nr:mRNA export factor elf1 [Grifola frondosa]
MSPVAMPVSSESHFGPFLEALRTAPTNPDAKAAADRLAREVSKAGLESLTDNGILSALHDFATNKKSGFERESAPIAFQSLVTVLGAPVVPLLLPSLPVLYELYMDKGDVVRSAATSATKSILKLFPPEATGIVFRTLEDILEKGKWKTKVGVLDAMKSFVTSARDAVANELGAILPKVEAAMHDTKQEVSSAANKCATALCTTLANPDLSAHIPSLVKCMSNPDSVPACIKSLSSTTFVAEVTAPALAVLVPLLIRALNDRSMEVQRRSVVVIDNLVKLVRDPKVAATYLSPLVEGVDKIAKGAAFPEVRAFAETALNTLIKAGASKDGPPPDHRDTEAEKSSALSALLTLLPSELVTRSPKTPNGPPAPRHPLLSNTLDFVASLVADLVYARRFSEPKIWNRCVGVYLGPWLPRGAEEGTTFAESVRSHFLAIDEAKHAITLDNSAEEGELLCDTQFSLAYGALLLLSHTRLRLFRGRRYGILGTNGSGKSTLMRQLRDGKVENFPTQDQLRCVMVEHSLQGEDISLSIIDFVASDKALAGVPRSKIRDQLIEVGFDDARQAELVGGLSGGWKMKLELGRAMLYNADLLLLDEPTNHLDRASVQWLEQYLIAQKNVTCLIISHDSGFLDTVTTDIIHYETKKLAYYPGNLSAFVAKHPEAKSYYTLAATSVKFSFPPPGSLMGVRSNTRAILKMTNCTFTYPGRSTPSLYNVSCALSLSSRVGIIGPNGAGKSTLIKLLTGETVPQEGTVYKHPALRIGYVSQHATHHIERHLEKTPIQYIQWRFQDGHDREILEKATRVLTEEEKAQLEVDFMGKNGQRRKLELIMGRQKLKKSLQYEIKWRGLDHRFNTWIPREELLQKGFTKLVQQFDDLESSREGAGQRDTAAHVVRKHLEDIGLDGDIAQYNEISGLSGGQKIKLVIAACLWNNPQICVLDEPSNFLDREALGGLAVAIRDWAGAVVIISHNEEFVTSLCPEIWHVDAGRMTHKGKVAVVEDPLAVKSPKGSGSNTPIRSRVQTPAASTHGTPAVSGAEDTPAAGATLPVKKKKKLTRNQVKAQEERRRVRKFNWLAFGGPKPEDTDSDA